MQDEIAAIADRALGEVATPGVQIALWRDGKPLSSFARGRANLETGTGTTIGSVFRIGSLTKQFTAALVALLAEQGMLELDAPASRYLPFLRKQPVFSVAELIHHTAGLHADEQAAPLSGEVTQSRVAEAIAAQNNLFDFPPGTAWQYSNANYHVLGAIIEQVTGQTLAEAADTRLFSRLALSHTASTMPPTSYPGVLPAMPSAMAIRPCCRTHPASTSFRPAGRARCAAPRTTCAVGTRSYSTGASSTVPVCRRCSRRLGCGTDAWPVRSVHARKTR